MAESLIGVPPEVLKGFSDAMLDAVAEARATRKETIELRRELAEHRRSTEPALKDYAAYLQRLTAEDSQQAAAAKAAAAQAAAMAETHRVEDQTKRAQEGAKLRSLIVSIVIAIASSLLTAGGITALGSTQ